MRTPSKDWKSAISSSLQDRVDNEREDKAGTAQSTEVVEAWIKAVVCPALEEFKAEIEKQGRQCEVNCQNTSATLKVKKGLDVEFHIRIATRIYTGGASAYPEERWHEDGQNYRSEGYFRSGSQDYQAVSLTREELLTYIAGRFADRQDMLYRQSRRRP